MACFVFGEEPNADIHFAGYVTESNFTLFSLNIANGDRTTAKWAEIADSFSGYILKSFDPKTEELVLARGDELMKLTPEISQIRKTVFADGKEKSEQNQSSRTFDGEEAKMHFLSFANELLAKAKKIPTYKRYDPDFETQFTGKMRRAIDKARERAEATGVDLLIMDVKGKPAYFNYTPIEKLYPQSVLGNLTADDLRRLNIAVSLAATEYNMALANAGLLN